MSLVDDFALYYRGTYIGYRGRDGRVRPFYVEGVNRTQRFEGHGEENLQYLRFSGCVVDRDDSQVWPDSIDYNEAILQLPDLGYVKIGQRWIWLAYRSLRQAAKGLTGRRLSGSSLNNNVAKQIYRAMHDQPDSTTRQFHFFDNGDVGYKGRKVGIHLDGVVTLHPEVRYLVPYINKCFPDKTVEVGA